jgi:acyl-CoA synthetase (AMP-forming)/AMP-acid ligase II
MHVPLTISDFLRRATEVYPHRSGIIDEPDQPASSWDTITYGELAQRAAALAAGLDALGVGVGERVAIVSHNSARLLTSMFGVCGSGRILVPINFRLTATEIGYIVEHCGATVLLVDPELDEALSSVTCQHRFVLGGNDTLADTFPTAADPQPWVGDENATATINYTSGTTGRPKGVELTHRNIWLNATVFGWQLGISDDDVYLHTLPQFHCNGWGLPFAATAMGVPQVILRKVDGAEILRRVQAHAVTVLAGAPAVANAICDAAASWDGPIPGAGRTRMVVAGAAPPTRTIERIEAELGWEFIQIYGLTETTPLLTMNRRRLETDNLPAPHRASLLSRAGVPALGIEVRTSPDGEIVARGNHVMRGYWQQPDATADAIHPVSDDPNGPDWFHSGDGGSLDDDAYLTISDRRKDVIITGGENVSSIEVEDAIFSHPDVVEVAVIGVPDDKWGEMVLALVVLAAGADLTAEDVIAYARTRLAGFKCPKAVEFRSSLDRTATGKLQKFKLRQPYWADTERAVN